MKHLILCILLAATAAGQSTGDYLLQRKTATGYEPKTITPESGKVLSWDGSGNPTNVTPVTSLTWEAISGKPSTFAPSAHNHTLSELSQSGATSGQVPTWNGSAWAPATPGGGSFASLTGQPTDNANLSSALGLKVDLSQLSTIGGVNKVPQFDASGDLKIGPTDTDDTYSATGGNIRIPGRQQIQFELNGGAIGANIYLYGNHGGTAVNPAPELLFNSARHCFYWEDGFQIGNATSGGNNRFIYIHSGGANAGVPLLGSSPLYFQTSAWDAAMNAGAGGYTYKGIGVQSVPTDSANNHLLRFAVNSDIIHGKWLNGDVVAELSEDGFWDVGSAPTFSSLPEAAGTVTQTCSKFKAVQTGKITLTADWSLNISGALAGMRGVIYVTQGAGAPNLLSLPTGSATTPGWALSTVQNTIDRLSWEFDGTNYFWTIDKGITLGVEAEASSFFTRADSATWNTAQQSKAELEAILNNLVVALKTSNVDGAGTLWSKAYAIYPFIGGNSTSHSKNLKADIHNILWTGAGVTHDLNGITGNGTTAWGNTQFNFADDTGGTGQNSASAAIYCRTQTPTDGVAYIFGADQNAPNRMGIARNGTVATYAGPMCDDRINIGVSSNFRRFFGLNRSGASSYEHYLDLTRTTGTTASTTPTTNDIYVLGRNNAGSVASFSNANIAFLWMGKSLSQNEWNAFHAIVTTFQEALIVSTGPTVTRKNP